MGTQVLRPHGGKASLIFRWTLPSLAISSFAALDPPDPKFLCRRVTIPVLHHLP